MFTGGRRTSLLLTKVTPQFGGSGMKPSICAAALPATRLIAKVADYVELTKPRIALLVLFTVATGALVAPVFPLPLGPLLHTLIGTALVAAGASALNQWLERHSDALMRRTENRPLPAGRLQAGEVLFFGLALGIAAWRIWRCACASR